MIICGTFSCFQKEVEIGDLNDLKNALDDACNQKAREVEECRIEIQALGEKLTNSDAVTAEIRVSSLTYLKMLIVVFSKASKSKLTHCNKRSQSLRRLNLTSMGTANQWLMVLISC